MRRRPERARIFVSVGVLCICIGAVILLHDYPQRVELSRVFDNYLRVVQAAELSKEVTQLGSVVVSPHLALVLTSIETRKDSSEAVDEEFKEVQVTNILEYSSLSAVADVHYVYRRLRR